VEAVLVAGDDVGEAQRLLVSGGVLQHAEQQEAEAGQTQRAQRRHLVAALGIRLRILRTQNVNVNVVFFTETKLSRNLGSAPSRLPVCCRSSSLRLRTAARCRSSPSRLPLKRPGGPTRRTERPETGSSYVK